MTLLKFKIRCSTWSASSKKQRVLPLNGRRDDDVAMTLVTLGSVRESSNTNNNINVDSISSSSELPLVVHEEMGGKWRDRFLELCQYKKEYGDCLVPDGYTKNPKLARWVREQRGQYKRAIADKTSYMTRQRLDALNKLNFTWTLRDKVEWKLRYEEFVLFKAQHGNCLVPST